MRKLVVIALVAVGLQLATVRPAHATCGRIGSCPPWVSAIGYTIAGSIVVGYAGATGYFAYRDLTERDQPLRLSGWEIGFNGIMGTIMIGGTVSSIRDHHYQAAIAPGALALVHTTLAIHGISNAWSKRDHLGRLDPPSDTLPWLVGIAYGTNTLLWSLGDIDDHARGYGIAEIAVNAPFAAGAGYLAVSNLTTGPSPRGVLFGALAVWSGVLVYHGAKTALHPYESPGLDLLGTDVTPTVVSDGVQEGAGLAMSGSW